MADVEKIQKKMSDKDQGEDQGNDGKVGSEEFTNLQKKVERLENSVGNIVNKIDAVLLKLEDMERAKSKRREAAGRMIADKSG